MLVTVAEGENDKMKIRFVRGLSIALGVAMTSMVVACGDTGESLPVEPAVGVTQQAAYVPASCVEADSVCFADKIISGAKVLSQLAPGCGYVETALNVITTGNEIYTATTLVDRIHATGLGVCDVLGCVVSVNPIVIQLQAACAVGSIGDAWIRCNTLRAECAHDMLMAQPVNPSVDFACPYAPSGQACSPGGGPADEQDVVAACNTVVTGYPGLDSNTRNQCMAKCVGLTLASSASCPPPLTPPLATPALPTRMVMP